MTPTPITITHLGAETCVNGFCHLKHGLDPKNDLFFMGFQAQGGRPESLGEKVTHMKPKA